MKLAFLSLLCFIASVACADVIYSNNFDSTVGNEWSSTITRQTPSGERFLGQWSNSTVSLALDSLPNHEELKLEFDLYIIQTMDGNNGDLWTLSIQDGPILLNTTFTNLNNSGRGPRQSYPDNYPGSNAAHTGASAIRTLGYKAGDSTYHLTYIFEHALDDIVINFQGSGMQSTSDESWGLDNLTVEVIPEPATLLLFAFGGLALRKRKGR